MSLYIISFVETVPLLRFSEFSFVRLRFQCCCFFLLLFRFLCCFYTFSFTWTVHTFLLFYNSFVSKCYSYFFQMFSIFFLFVRFLFLVFSKSKKTVIGSFVKNFGYFYPVLQFFFCVLRTKIIKQYFSFEIWHVDVWIWIHFFYFHGRQFTCASILAGLFFSLCGFLCDRWPNRR